MIRLKLSYNELHALNNFLNNVHNYIVNEIERYKYSSRSFIPVMRYNAELDEVKRLIVKVSSALLKTFIKTQKKFLLQITKTQGYILFDKNPVIPKDSYTLAVIESQLLIINQALI